MNNREKAELLIEKVCDYYKIKKSFLGLSLNSRLIRLYTYYENKKRIKVDVASLRMALSFYLTKYTDVPTSLIGPMCGYADHTTIVYVKQKATNYISQYDERFIPYWMKVNEIATQIGMTTNLVRLSQPKVIHMVSNVND